MPELVVSDADVTLWHGDVLDVLAELADGSVDCVVTSPPYWGLRDYGTGGWEGGDPDCEHVAVNTQRTPYANSVPGPAGASAKNAYSRNETKEVGGECGRCGARRVDQQLGLEPTPDQYVQRIVEVFREVRRVLAAHGTCWVNLGDSYAQDTLRHRRDVSDTDWAKNYGHVDNHVGTAVGGLKAKDLCGIPWRVAFALQADGWWLRSDIIWAKPNPMPESVTDRPTKAHEYVFLLTKQPRYWFDAEAVREDCAPKTLTHRGGGKAAGKVGQQDGGGKVASGNFGDWDKPRTAYPRPVPQDETLDGSDGEAPRGPDGRRNTHVEGADGSIQYRDGERWPNGGRNVRSVWTVATQPYPEAHFATYPEELVRRCVLAGCPERVCVTCGKPSERLTSTEYDNPGNRRNNGRRDADFADSTVKVMSGGQRLEKRVTTEGWSDCGHNTWRAGRVLDPFIGSGTTCKVARDHGRHSIGIDLSAEYLKLAARRLQQLSLLSELP